MTQMTQLMPVARQGEDNGRPEAHLALSEFYLIDEFMGSPSIVCCTRNSVTASILPVR
jgi:hypothetical protein